MVLTILRRLIVSLLLLLTCTGGPNVATPENEKQLFADLAQAYKLSTTKMNKSLSKAYQDASDRIVLEPPVVTPPPVITPPPTSGTWPKDLTANPTGPKKPLPAYAGEVTITEDNKVIDGLNASVLNVNANNVTIRNFQVETVKKQPGKSGLTLEDGKIDGQNKQENAVEWSDYKCVRTEVTRTTDAFKAHGSVTIDSCYIHDLNFQTGAGTGAGGYTHSDGVQVSSGNNIVIKNSRFENIRGNSAVFVDADQGTISGVSITENYFNNVGNYPIYVKQSASAPQYGLPDKITITNNVIDKRRDDTPADWGPMLAEVHATNLVWSGNKTEAGKEIKLDSYGKGYVV